MALSTSNSLAVSTQSKSESKRSFFQKADHTFKPYIDLLFVDPSHVGMPHQSHLWTFHEPRAESTIYKENGIGKTRRMISVKSVWNGSEFLVIKTEGSLGPTDQESFRSSES